jgi:hypothetical protein
MLAHVTFLAVVSPPRYALIGLLDIKQQRTFSLFVSGCLFDDDCLFVGCAAPFASQSVKHDA